MRLLVACFVGFFFVPSLVWAENGNARLYEKAMRKNQQAMELYALENGKSPPEVVRYEYGMKLDIQRVVNRTNVDKSCSAAPARMTYEDSQRALHTLEYTTLGLYCMDDG